MPIRRSGVGNIMAAPQLPAGTAFADSFTTTSNPIRPSIYLTGFADGGGHWQDPQSVSTGKAFSTGFAGQSFSGNSFDDDIAVLKTSVATLANDQWSEATIFLTPGYAPSNDCEIEVLNRFGLSSGNAQGYEVLWALQDGHIAVVKWLGGPGLFTPILDNFSIGIPKHGDVLRAEYVGNNCTVKLNGATKATVDLTNSGALSVWGSGQPGFGFYVVTGGSPVTTLTDYGLSSFRTGNM